MTKHDEDRHHDNWLTGISSKDIKKVSFYKILILFILSFQAAEAKSRFEAAARERARADSERAKVTVDDLLLELFNHLQPRETLSRVEFKIFYK